MHLPDSSLEVFASKSVSILADRHHAAKARCAPLALPHGRFLTAGEHRSLLGVASLWASRYPDVDDVDLAAKVLVSAATFVEPLKDERLRGASLDQVVTWVGILRSPEDTSPVVLTCRRTPANYRHLPIPSQAHLGTVPSTGVSTWVLPAFVAAEVVGSADDADSLELRSAPLEVLGLSATVLETAFSLWEPTSKGPFENLEQVVPAAAALTA